VFFLTAPIKNYITWFIVGILSFYLFQYFKSLDIKKQKRKNINIEREDIFYNVIALLLLVIQISTYLKVNSIIYTILSIFFILYIIIISFKKSAEKLNN